MIPRLIAAVLIVSAAPGMVRASESFCAQIDIAGFENRQVSVTYGAGNQAVTVSGLLVAVEPGTLILQLNATNEMKPLYDGTQIANPTRQLMYLNCDAVISVGAERTP
jgi:hypothetical protein